MGLQILKFGQGKTRTEGGGFQNVEGIFVDLQVYQTSWSNEKVHLEIYLGNPGPQNRANKEFEPFELCLNYNKSKVGLRVRIARLQLH